jgi:hypothetical protein
VCPIGRVHRRNTLNLSEVSVQTNFDIYKRLRSGKPVWITSVPEIEEARVRINRLEGIAPGEYLIYSEEKGLVVERVTS